jgi:hypothetical protein
MFVRFARELLLTTPLVRPLKLYSKGSKLADIYSDIVPYKVISKNFQSVLTSNCLTGFELLDVDVTLHNAESGNDTYFNGLKELNVFGRTGKLRSKDQSELENCLKCHRVKPSVKNLATGLYIDLNEWDGTDLFYFSN